MTRVHSGIIGDYEPDRVPHIATEPALVHGADALGLSIRVDWLPTSTRGGSSTLTKTLLH